MNNTDLDSFGFNPVYPQRAVTFESGTYDPTNAYSKSTTVPNPGVNSYGVAYPSANNKSKKKVPYGTIVPSTGMYTKNFRGLNVINPWNGGKIQYKNKQTMRKRRNTRRTKSKSMRRTKR
jgi:hypothetical protein